MKPLSLALDDQHAVEETDRRTDGQQHQDAEVRADLDALTKALRGRISHAATIGASP